MDNLKKKIFLTIKSNILALNVIGDDSKMLFNENLLQDNLEDYSISLNKFLDEKIFKVEKKFNFYIKDIYLIIEDKNLDSCCIDWGN